MFCAKDAIAYVVHNGSVCAIDEETFGVDELLVLERRNEKFGESPCLSIGLASNAIRFPYRRCRLRDT